MEEKTIMEQFIDCLKNNPDHAYDFISQNYYKFSKDELNDIIKELLYSIYSNVSKAEHNMILDDVADELKEQYEE